MEPTKKSMFLLSIFLIATVTAQSNEVPKVLDNLVAYKSAVELAVVQATADLNNLASDAQTSSNSMKDDASNVVDIKRVEWLLDLDTRITQAQERGIDVTDCVSIANSLDDCCKKLPDEISTGIDSIVAVAQDFISKEVDVLEQAGATHVFMTQWLGCGTDANCLEELSDTIVKFTTDIPPAIVDAVESLRNVTLQTLENATQFEMEFLYGSMRNYTDLYLDGVNCVENHTINL